MFGFGKKKSEPPPKTGRRSSDGNREQSKAETRAQLNVFGIGDEADLDVDDGDLEDELLALLGEGGAGKKTKSPQRRPPPPSAASAKRPVMDPFAIPDVSETIDDGDDDDDDDIDEAELEAELGFITRGDSNENELKVSDDTAALIPPATPEPPPRAVGPPPAAPTASKESTVKMLQERLVMYETAKAKADSMGDSAKSRRFTRAIKTLKELVGKAKAGKAIDENDIPPVVAVGDSKPKPPSQPEEMDAPPPIPPRKEEVPVPVFEPIPQIPSAVVEPLPPEPVPASEPAASEPTPVDPVVEARLKDYKRMAYGLKKSGDIPGAVQYLKLVKALESAIKSGAPIDLSAFPSLPEPSETSNPQPPAAEAPPALQSAAEESPTPEAGPPPSEVFGAPPPPTTVMEALEQRLEKYKSEVEKASEANNSSKARRMGRIVKQYEEAITFYKRGKVVPFDELPTPPGFAPIPLPGSSGASVSAAGGGAPSGPPAPAPSVAVPPKAPVGPPSGESPSKPLDQGPSASPASSVAGPSKSPGSGQGSSINRVVGKPVSKLTLQEKQLALITKRQREFKEAAAAAKKRGDIDQARELLRTAKGFDKLIQASQGGLPVDMNTLPCAPQALEELEAENFEVISGDDCLQPEGGSAEVFSKLEEDLKNQCRMCMRTRDHYKSIGDVASANRFERLAIESKRDLDTLRLAARQGGTLPKYHYETRVFSITECNTDLNEDEIEISVIQGVNYKVPNPADVDTFVKVELPYPSVEEAQVNKTGVVKDTNNPAYDATFKMSVNRSARNFQRFVHRHGVKLEVWSKGGFLRSSTLIGTATAKLVGLETKCTVHEAFDILEGRKSVGKLEVKIRLRDPVLAKQITQKKEKWLSIDRA